MVLKKELVQVQTLMDQMTRESEKKNVEVERERQNLQSLLDEANTKAQFVQKEFDQFKVQYQIVLKSLSFGRLLHGCVKLKYILMYIIFGTQESSCQKLLLKNM